MIKRMYSVYDVKAGIYGTLMCLLSDGEAIRVMIDTVNSKQPNTISEHPSDFRLDYLGDINLSTGEIVQVDCPKHVIDVAQLVTERLKVGGTN